MTTSPIFAQKIIPEKDGLHIFIKEKEYFFLWQECSKLLAKASHIERMEAKLSPSGYGIHWKSIDEDLSVGPLIKNKNIKGES